jgi:hypothetical protein
MLDWLTGEQIYCERCEQKPHLKDCLGCGRPPTRDDDAAQALWDRHGNDFISPAEAVRRNIPPYRGIGHGPVVADWPWCPRGFASRLEGRSWGSDASVDGVPTAVYVQKAWEFWSRGMLADLVAPPWTPALVRLLLFYDQLEKVDRIEREKSQADMLNARLAELLKR